MRWTKFSYGSARPWTHLLFLPMFLLNFMDGMPQDSRAKDFNGGWRFMKGDGSGFEKSSFDDTSWRELDLPHDWSVEGPFSDAWASGTGYLPGGIGWYRKSFVTTPELLNKTVYIYFDGVYKNSEVWINGVLLGKRPNGYSSFYYNITPHLRKKGSNVIAVKVDHTDFADSRWYTGSGINRKVYLIVTNPVHIGIWGVAFTTPNVSPTQAAVNVSVDVNNSALSNQRATVVTELISSDRIVVAKSSSEIQRSSKVVKATQSFNVDNPKLWSIDTPNLYKLRVSVVIGGKVIDEVTEQVSFRTFAFDSKTGFTLNGLPLKIKGVCVHDDAGALGSAVPAAVWERRLKMLKSAGCNAIRMSHNPHQDYFYDLCDRLGLLVQDEAFDEWEISKNKWIKGWNVGQPGKDGYAKDFNVWAERDLTDMILRNRNRGCIIMWSIGNEIDYPNDPYTHEVLNTGRNPQIYGKGHQPGNPSAKALGVIAERLVKVAKKADPTRAITAALAGVVMSNETSYPDHLDLVGYNYQEYRYADDHAIYPNRIIYGSENGQSPDAWRAVEENDFISAQFLWTGIDFLGEARAWPVRSSGAGLLDLAGFPKTQYYIRRMLWIREPAVVVTTSKVTAGRGDLSTHWNYATGDSVNIVCVTNTDGAEAFLNGHSFGFKKSTGIESRLIWRIPFQSGELVVKGYRGDAVVAENKLTTTAPASKIVVSSDHERIAVNRDSVAHIFVQVSDPSGLIVNDASNEIEFVINGPGKIIGLESGDLASHENYKATARKLYKGKLLAYIQATATGEIKIEIKSNGLSPAVIKLKAE